MLTVKVRVLAFPEDLRGLLQPVGEVVDQVLRDQALGAGAGGRGPPDRLDLLVAVTEHLETTNLELMG